MSELIKELSELKKTFTQKLWIVSTLHTKPSKDKSIKFFNKVGTCTIGTPLYIMQTEI